MRSATVRSAIGLDVLFVIDGLGAGGAERSLAELLGPLVERGHRPVIARFHDRGTGVEVEVRAAGHEVVAVPGRGALTRARMLRRLMRERRPDLVHSTLFAANLATRLALAGSSTPLLTSLVSTNYDATRRAGPVAGRRITAVQWVDRITAKRVDHFHAISKAVASDAARNLDIAAERMTVITRGRDRDRLGHPGDARRARVRDALSIAADAPVVLTTGREEHAKGHVHLVRATSILLDRHPDAVVLVAGRRGAASVAIDEAAKEAGVGASLRRLGHREDIGDLLSAADVFAFPSLWEGLGGATLEAMAMGLPVVASDLPVLRETLEPGGCSRFVHPADPAALASSLAALIEDPAARQTMGQAGRARFESHHRQEVVAAAMIDLLEAVAGGGRRSAGHGGPPCDVHGSERSRRAATMPSPARNSSARSRRNPGSSGG